AITNETVSMPEFAEKFKYFSRKDADDAYSSLISKSFIASSTRNALKRQYGIWNRNEGDQFWASRTATLSKTQVAGDLVAESVPVARQLISEDTLPAGHNPITQVDAGMQEKDILSNSNE
ncbi:hypothetical protein BGZ46_006219, partial [Entomortierella lignicola]